MGKKRLLKDRRKSKLEQIPSEVREISHQARARELRNLQPHGTLISLRALGKMWLLTRQMDTNLRKQLVQIFFLYKVSPEDLGSKNLADFITNLKKMMTAVNYPRYTLKELQQKAEGLAWLFAGKLFELFVLYHRRLHADLKLMARDALVVLNEAIIKQSAFVVNALGQPVPMRTKFKGIYLATNIWVHLKDGKKEFIDFAYVSFTEGRRNVSFLVNVETKLPAAAKNFRKQIGVQQLRFGDADFLEMTVNGQKEHFSPADIIFNTALINRVGVTASKGKLVAGSTLDSDGYAENLRFSFTESGGYHEGFLVIKLKVKGKIFHDIVRSYFMILLAQ